MSIWPGIPKQASGAIARKRLKLLLVADKTDCSPEILEKMKDDIVHVISNYIEIDKDGIEIQVVQSRSIPTPKRGPVIRANIPLCRGSGQPVYTVPTKRT